MRFGGQIAAARSGNRAVHHVLTVPMSEPETGTPKEPIDVYAVLAVMVDNLASFGWQKLGLQPDLATGTVVRDLAQAKAAIDGAAALSAILEPQLDEADRRQLQNLVRDLRINYIEKTKEAGS